MSRSAEKTGHPDQHGDSTKGNAPPKISAIASRSSFSNSFVQFNLQFNRFGFCNVASPASRPTPLVPPKRLSVGDVVSLVPGVLSFAVHSSLEMTREKINAEPDRFYFSSHCQDLYEPFCADFGPVNLYAVHMFCNFMREYWNHPQLRGRELVYYTDEAMNIRTNTAFLLAAFMLIELDYSPEDAWAPFKKLTQDSFATFRDATYCEQKYHLTILACLQGLSKAMECGFYDPETFDSDEYNTLDDPWTADMHVLCPKFIAFRGPQESRGSEEQAGIFTPAHYIEVFRNKGVSAVVRLNEPDTYDRTAFTKKGINHHELYFHDCTVPRNETVAQFLDTCEKEPGMVAVHCKAGLGRTGTLIAIYLMKHYGFTASECIGWLRIVRPGSIIGPQQQYLHHAEQKVRADAFSLARDPAQASLESDPVEMDEPNLAASQAMGMLVAGAQKARAARLAHDVNELSAASTPISDTKKGEQLLEALPSLKEDKN